METIVNNHRPTNTLVAARLDHSDLARADRADRAAGARAITPTGLSLPRNHARPRLMATPFFRKKS